MNELKKLIKAVAYMRDCQKNYKKNYSDAAKSEMVKAEQNVDRILLEYKQKQEENIRKQQNELF